MPVKVFMPKLSPTMEKTGGKLVKWHKKEGDHIESGDVLADVETDKAVMEMESSHTGVIGKILAAEGKANIKIGETIAIILAKGESLSDIPGDFKSLPADAVMNKTQDNKTQPILKKDESIRPEYVSNSCTSGNNEQNNTDNEVVHSRVKASPLAKSVAVKHSVDLSNVTGSGPSGRIVKDDVMRVVSSKEKGFPLPENNWTIVPISPMRYVIADRLLESKKTIPHFYLTLECEVDKLLQLREEKNLFDGQNKLTINDFFVRAVAIVIKDFPIINSSWTEDGIKVYSTIDVCVAVSLDDGLITPVVCDADKKSISEISSEIKSLTKRARNKELKPHEFSSGGITVSTLGMFGIKQFCAIINPPQSSILAIGQSEIKPVFDQSSKSFVPKNVISLTLSADHRVIDGVVAAKFLQTLKKQIELPISLFV